MSSLLPTDYQQPSSVIKVKRWMHKELENVLLVMLTLTEQVINQVYWAELVTIMLMFVVVNLLLNY